MLTLNNLRPARGSKTTRKRLGRGNATGKGTTAGRGGKGQTARSGGSSGLKLLGMRHLMLATPKLRGFRSHHPKAYAVSLSTLSKEYKDGEIVNLKSLKDKNLIPGTAAKAKVLNTGSLTKKVVVAIDYSETAKEKILAAGGKIAE